MDTLFITTDSRYLKTEDERAEQPGAGIFFKGLKKNSRGLLSWSCFCPFWCFLEVYSCSFVPLPVIAPQRRNARTREAARRRSDFVAHDIEFWYLKERERESKRARVRESLLVSVFHDGVKGVVAISPPHSVRVLARDRQ